MRPVIIFQSFEGYYPTQQRHRCWNVEIREFGLTLGNCFRVAKACVLSGCCSCEVGLFDEFKWLRRKDPSLSIISWNPKIIKTLSSHFIISLARFEVSFFQVIFLEHTKLDSLITVVNGGHQLCLYLVFFACSVEWMTVYFCAVFNPLTLALRAVEVFIRDKYERKRYYNREALATAHVSIN